MGEAWIGKRRAAGAVGRRAPFGEPRPRAPRASTAAPVVAAGTPAAGRTRRLELQVGPAVAAVPPGSKFKQPACGRRVLHSRCVRPSASCSPRRVFLVYYTDSTYFIIQGIAPLEHVRGSCTRLGGTNYGQWHTIVCQTLAVGWKSGRQLPLQKRPSFGSLEPSTVRDTGPPLGQRCAPQTGVAEIVQIQCASVARSVAGPPTA